MRHGAWEGPNMKQQVGPWFDLWGPKKRSGHGFLRSLVS